MQEDNNSEQTSMPTPGAVVSPDSGNQASPSASPPPVVTPEQPTPIQEMPQLSQIGRPAFPPKPTADLLQDNEDGISWNGPEFVSHEKNSEWYGMTVAAAIILGVLIYFVTSRDLVSALTVAIAVMILGFYGLRKPKLINFGLGLDGISIGNKQVVYEEIRAFTAVTEGEYLNITLFPHKRFGPPLGLCYRGQNEDRIVEFLSERLPMEQHKSDIIENFLQRIRF